MSLGLLELINDPSPERETAVDSEGFIYDLETGEVVGHSGVHEPGGTPDRFHVTTEAEADWALELRSKVEGNIAALEARKAALVANLDAKIAAESRRLSWWEWRLAPGLVEFARSQLRGKSRTWRGAWGSVSFRTNPGSTEIADMGEAVRFVDTWAPELVKVVRSVGVKEIAEARRAAEGATGEDVPTPFARTSGPQETVKVSTGVEVQPQRKGKRS